MLVRRIGVVFLVFGALVIAGHARADTGLPDDRARVDLSDGPRAIVADIDFRGRDLRVVVPHRLGRIDVDDARTEVDGRIEIVIDARTIELDRAMSLSTAYAIARLRLEPRLDPSGPAPRNRLADRSEFARVSGELRQMLELALPRHAELRRRLDELCELSCVDAGVKLVADGLAAAALLLGREDGANAELQELVGSLIEESVSAVALRVGVSCPACDGSACVLEAARPVAPAASTGAS